MEGLESGGKGRKWKRELGAETERYVTEETCSLRDGGDGVCGQGEEEKERGEGRE